MGSWIGIAQVAATVIGAAVSFYGQQKQAKAAKRRAAETTAARQRTEALQKRREDIVAARQRRRSFAEARRFRGGAVNLAAVRGVGGAIGAQGSIVPGVTANIAQQLNANNAFINQVTALNVGIRSAQGAVADIAGRPITAGSGLVAFGGLLGSRGVGQAFSFFGGSGDGGGGGGGGGFVRTPSATI